MRTLTLLALASLGVAACSEPSSRRSPEPSARRVAPAAPPTPTRPAPPALPEADVRAIFDSWLSAQNRGDFDAYEPLYASRFQGVRRNDDRSRAFDRVGWLDDRRRMFRRPIVVSASDVRIRTSATTADVTFTQHWSSGTYSDEGPKRLLLVRERGALKIAVEEMLAARRLGDLDAALALGTFVALPTRRGPVAIVADAPESDATGAPELLTDEDPYIVAKDAGTSIPASVTALVGRTVSVIERGRACEGTITGVRIVRLVIPHFGVVATWSGEEGTPPAPPAQRALEAWNLGTSTYYAATVRSTCTNVVAVSLAATANVDVFAPRVPTSDERATLETSFERTRRFGAREAAYRAYVADADPASALPAPPGEREAWRRDASVVAFESGPRRVAAVVHNAEGCGGFDVSAWAGFELTGSNARELPEAVPIGDYVSVMAVFDVDRDGTLEAIVRRDLASYGIIRFAPGTSLLRRVDVDYLDCPC